MWEVLQYFGLRQDAVVLSSSRQTELKAHLSSKSLTLFLLNEGGGNWTRTVRGQLNEGGDAAAGTCDAATSWHPQVK